MSRRSAGLLLYRLNAGSLEVLLVHPGGPFWARKDAGAWSIPKGELADGEDPLQAARRECLEELGAPADGDFQPLRPCRQAGGKTVYAWAVKSDFDPAGFSSNTFAMEWPPRSGRQQTFPEVDRAAWFPIDVARTRIVQGQLGLLDELAQMVGRDELS